MKPIPLAAVLLITLMSCQTVKTAVAPDATATQYRGLLGQLTDSQAETAMTGIKIQDQTAEIVSGLADLETAMAGAPDSGAWLTQVQGLRTRAETLQGETETLNRQLSAEREIGAAIRSEFEQYQQEKSVEITALKYDIMDKTLQAEKYRGKYRTVLGILIAAISVLVLVVAYRILKIIRVI